MVHRKSSTFSEKHATTLELEYSYFQGEFCKFENDKPREAEEILVQNLISDDLKRNSFKSKLQVKSYVCFKEGVWIRVFGRHNWAYKVAVARAKLPYHPNTGHGWAKGLSKQPRAKIPCYMQQKVSPDESRRVTMQSERHKVTCNLSRACSARIKHLGP